MRDQGLPLSKSSGVFIFLRHEVVAPDFHCIRIKTERHAAPLDTHTGNRIASERAAPDVISQVMV